MLTLEEFRRLPDEEKGERYKEMSDHDKFLWRISEPLVGRTVGEFKRTEEEEKADHDFFVKYIEEHFLRKKKWYKIIIGNSRIKR